MSARKQSFWRTLMRLGVVSVALSAVIAVFMAMPSAEEAAAASAEEAATAAEAPADVESGEVQAAEEVAAAPTTET
mgnify:CR=1 FL=1